jgi:hypothetical protein
MVTVVILLSPGFRMKSIPMLISLIGLFPALWRIDMIVYVNHLMIYANLGVFGHVVAYAANSDHQSYWVVPGTLEA